MSRPRRKQEPGFALLLVMAMAAVIAVMLYREMPRVAFEGQRAKEELLVQRGEQYYRAIQLYTRKFGRYPSSIEQLENTNNMRFLRRRYKDPMTGSEEWRMIHAGPGGIFTDAITRKPPQLNKDGKLASGQTPSGTGTPDAAAVAAPVDPNAPKPGWRPRRPSDMAGFTPPPASEGSAESAGYSPPPQDPNDPNYTGQQAGAPSQQQPEPGQLQYPYAQGQVVAGQPMQPGQGGVIGISGGMVTPQAGGNPQPGFQPAQPESGESGAVQGSPDQQPQPQPQPQYPAQILPGGASYGQQRPPGPYGNPQQFGQQQPINPVTPYAPQPPLQNPGMGSGTTAPDPNANPALRAIQAQLTGATARTGFAGTGGQTLGGGIAGVASKAEAEGIKVYKKHTKYNEWEFIYVPTEDLTNPNARGVIAQPGFGAGATTSRPGGPTQ